MKNDLRVYLLVLSFTFLLFILFCKRLYIRHRRRSCFGCITPLWHPTAPTPRSTSPLRLQLRDWIHLSSGFWVGLLGSPKWETRFAHPKHGSRRNGCPHRSNRTRADPGGSKPRMLETRVLDLDVLSSCSLNSHDNPYTIAPLPQAHLHDRISLFALEGDTSDPTSLSVNGSSAGEPKGSIEGVPAGQGLIGDGQAGSFSSRPACLDTEIQTLEGRNPGTHLALPGPCLPEPAILHDHFSGVEPKRSGSGSPKSGQPSIRLTTPKLTVALSSSDSDGLLEMMLDLVNEVSAWEEDIQLNDNFRMMLVDCQPPAAAPSRLAAENTAQLHHTRLVQASVPTTKLESIPEGDE